MFVSDYSYSFIKGDIIFAFKLSFFFTHWFNQNALFDSLRWTINEWRPNSVIVNHIQQRYLYCKWWEFFFIKILFLLFLDDLMRVKRGQVIKDCTWRNFKLIKIISCGILFIGSAKCFGIIKLFYCIDPLLSIVSFFWFFNNCILRITTHNI